MSSRTFCDRCGCCIDTQHGNSEMELRVCNHTIQGAVYHLDFCDCCTQSLEMWRSNLPNRAVKYLEMNHDQLQGGTFGDAVARIRDGADPAWFYRQAWLKDHDVGKLGWTLSKINTRLLRIISDDGHSYDLTAEDFLANDWCEARKPMPDDEGEEDEEGDA